MSYLDIPYVAGLIDSRAHIEPYRARLKITTQRIELLEWLAKYTGVKASTTRRDYHKRGCSEHCEERHQHITQESPYWTVRGLRAGIVLANVLPYLVCVGDQAYETLVVLQPTWPLHPRQNEIGAAMARLGWRIPHQSELPVGSSSEQ